MSTLDNFRKDAKRWLKALRAGDPDARRRLDRAYPAAPAPPTLRDVQHALAREQDAESWAALKARIASGAARGQSAPLAELLAAADAGDAARVAELAAAHPDLVSRRGTLPGHTGLRTALHFGVHHLDVVRTLLAHGADPNVRDEGDNAIPLHFAAERGDVAVIHLLVEHGSDTIGAGDGHELEVMGWLCVFGSGNRELVDYLLAHGARHNIMSAVAIGDVQAIEAIVRGDRSQLDRVMDGTNLRRRPLHLAVVKKQRAALETLILLGAALEEIDAAGLTALDQAAIDGETAMAEALLDAGAQFGLPAAIALNRLDDAERLLRMTPDALRPGGPLAGLIVRASQHGSGALIEALIRYGASVDVRDDPATSVDGTEGYTALHAAAWNGNTDAVRVLLRHGANPRVREEKYCATPAGWANYAGHTATREAILEGNVDVFDAIDLDRADLIPGILAGDRDALTRPYGAYAGCADLSEDERDATPLAWAIEHGKAEAARVLRQHGADAQRASGDVVSRFLRFACWDQHVYGRREHEMYAAAARRILKQHPALARDSLYTAIVCGDVEEVERILESSPVAATQPGGARDWPPLLYLCFARIAHRPTIDNAVRIATALLDRGADPNAFYIAGSTRFTALVGVAAEGQQDSPRQPQAPALFQLLLDRGANPWDIQVLYNTQFSGEVMWWLQLVYDHTTRTGGADVWADPSWSMFDMGAHGPASHFLLRVAIEHGNAALAEWVLSHGADPHAKPTNPDFGPRRTLYQEALAARRHDIASLLARHGADTSRAPADDLQDDERFTALCLDMDREGVARMIAANPDLLHHPQPIFAAAHFDRADVVAMLLDLGVPLEIEQANGQRLLHEAASSNAARVVRLLLDRGAEVDPRDPAFDGTPFGFAAHSRRRATMDLLSGVTEDICALTFNGYVGRVRDLLDRKPELANAETPDGYTALWCLPPDESVALQLADMLLSHGADPRHRNREGMTAAEWVRACAMTSVVRRFDAAMESS